MTIKIIEGMKGKFNGEFFIERESVYYDEHMCENVEFIEKIMIPWTSIKEIYKAMATFAEESEVAK